MSTPQRIQRKRTKGFRLPPNTVCVTRGTKWGNPWRVGKDGNAEECVEKYKKLVEANIWAEPNTKSIRKELRGKNLACWCKIGDCCHGDWLLKTANS